MDTFLTQYLAVLGAFTGCVGTAMGLWNLWLARKSHRVKMVLHFSCQPIQQDALGHPEPSAIDKATGVQVTLRVENRSYFGVRLTEAGLGSRTVKRRFYDILGANLNMPMIEGRDHYKWTMTFFLRTDKDSGGTVANKKLVDDSTFAYVKTVTGDTFYGCRKEVKELRKLIDALCEAHKRPDTTPLK